MSKQTVGQRDVGTLKNGQEEEEESAQRDNPLDGSRGEARSIYKAPTLLLNLGPPEHRYATAPRPY